MNRSRSIPFVLAVALAAWLGAAFAAQPTLGSAAPEFKLQDQNGKWHSLADYRGKWVTLPKHGWRRLDPVTCLAGRQPAPFGFAVARFFTSRFEDRSGNHLYCGRTPAPVDPQCQLPFCLPELVR